MANRNWLHLESFCLMLAVAGGCELGQIEASRDQPIILDISKHSFTIGETAYFTGQNFLQGNENGRTRLTLTGDYRRKDGVSERVEFSFEPLYDGTLTEGGQTVDVLRWSRFGPFSVPFGKSNQPGVFLGTVRATNLAADGTKVAGPDSQPIEIVVLPSVVILELQPIIADCGAPVLRGLSGMAYRLKVSALGIQPSRFRYTIDKINGKPEPTVIEHRVNAAVDTVGDEEPLVFNPLDPDEMQTVSLIRIEAMDDNGKVVETVLPLSVHRPIEFYYDGQQRLAEYLPPVPVSGCIPGSIYNRVCYSESDSEMKQQSLSITVAKDWTQSHSQSDSNNWSQGYSMGTTDSHSDTQSNSLSETGTTSQTYGVDYRRSQANEIGFSSTDGENWQWDYTQGTNDEVSKQKLLELKQEASLSNTVGIEGSASIPAVATVGANATTGTEVTLGAKEGWTEGERHAVNEERGYSAGGHRDETTSFGSTTTDSSGVSMSGTYSLSSNSTKGRSYTDESSRSQSKTYNLGGSATSEDLVSQGITESEQRTWVTSKTHTTMTQYCGVIPMGRYGTFYRQTIRMVRKAQIRSYNLCGQSEVLGEMIFNEWSWSPDLAIGESCAASLPPSQLPPPTCFIPPCAM